MFNFKKYRAKELKRKINNNNLFSPYDILLIGATGSGKSSSVDILLGTHAAKIGYGPDPETKNISSYMLNDYFRIWDTPGLGDETREDKEHSKIIISKLNEVFIKPEIPSKKFGLIDMVLVVIEAEIRDMGTVTQIIQNLVIPNIETRRVIIGINQADFAMKEKNFDYNKNCPTPPLVEYLNNKKNYIKTIIKENHGVEFPIVYYSAETGYNMDKLMDILIDHMPTQRRILEK